MLASVHPFDPRPAAAASLNEPKNLGRKEVSQSRKGPRGSSEAGSLGSGFQPLLWHPCKLQPRVRRELMELQVLEWVVKQSGLSPCQKMGQGARL